MDIIKEIVRKLKGNRLTDSNQKGFNHEKTIITEHHHSEEEEESSKREDLSEQITIITDPIIIIEDSMDKGLEIFNSEITHKETTILETK
ncbi:8181_t:CDS:1, partial [Ambispora leptoticha]